MIWLDRHGWPLVRIKGRPITNAIRWLLHVSVRRSLRERGRWQRATDGDWLTDTWCRAETDVPVECQESAEGASNE